jgi:NhaA family Na+:H+ antiporter
MAVPALVYLAFNGGSPAARGWAVPSATDIAFALGVMSLLGPRVPVSLKIFLAALAIIDDLGAVVIIALFYTAGLSLPYLALAGGTFALLLLVNRTGIGHLAVYLALGMLLWVFVWQSGVHATLSGVLLALAIPMKPTCGSAEATSEESPLHRLEAVLHRPVAFAVVPLFGFANAGLSFADTTLQNLLAPIPLGTAMGLLVGKLVGVFGAVAVLVRLGLASLPAGAGWMQIFGTALLCGIGFTMSLFIALLAFADPAAQAEVKLGIFMGSLLAGLGGYAVLRHFGQSR